MKTPQTIVLATAVLAVALGSAHQTQAQNLFSDNFTTSEQKFDVNFELPGVRASGSLAGSISYVDTDAGGGGYRTQVNEGSFPNALFVFPDGGGDGQQQYVSPNFNFDGFGGQLTISVVALNQAMEDGDFIGIDIGANNALDLPYGGSGFGLVLRPHLTGVGGQNNFEIYYGGGAPILTGNSAAVLANSNALSVTINASAFDGSPAGVNLRVNGTSLFNDTLPTGFTANFLTLGAASFSGNNEFYAFDNFSVTVVPEPGTAVSLIGGLGVLLAWRRRS